MYRFVAHSVYPGYSSAHVAASNRPSGDERRDEDQSGPDSESRSSSGCGINFWHARFGHANNDSVGQLLRTGAVTGMNLKTGKRRRRGFISCVNGKHTRQTARKNATKSLDPVAVIHTDVCGPISVSTFTGARYFVSVMDECTSYISIVPIARKSDVLLQFNLFHAWFQRRFGCTVKCMHSDNGREFIAL